MKLWKVGTLYHFRFQVGGVRVQRSTGTANKVEAQAIAAEALTEARNRKRGVMPAPTMEELRKDWLEHHAKTMSLGHWKNVERMSLEGMGEVKADRITTEMVEVARARVAAGSSPATANAWLRNFNLLGNWAVRMGKLPELPWAVRPLKVQRKPRPTLPVERVGEYLAALAEVRTGPGYKPFPRDAQVGTAVRLMIGLGLREKEALGARWEWLSWDRRTYTVGLAKGKEARVIPVPEWLLEHLRPLKRDLGLMLPNKDGEQHPAGFTRAGLRAANKAVGVQGLSPHRLRGTFATLHSETGTPLQVIQALLGHKNISTTMAYVEAHLETARAGQDRLAERMGLSGEKVAKTTRKRA